MDKAETETKQTETWQRLGTTPSQMVGPTQTGELLSAIGAGRPLKVSETIGQLRVVDTDHKLEGLLQDISGRLPVLQTSMRFPADGPAYKVVETVIWEPREGTYSECAKLVDQAFRAAPAQEIATALTRLRMLTRGREQRGADEIETEALIWIEQLSCYPGDVVIETLKQWPDRPDGMWWPTWHDVKKTLDLKVDRRKAIANHLKGLSAKAEKPPSIKVRDGLPEDPPDVKARVVAHWEEQKLAMQNKPLPEQAKHQAEEFLAAGSFRPTPQSPIKIGPGLGAYLDRMVDGASGIEIRAGLPTGSRGGKVMDNP